jgi:hypothetical protein
MINFFKFLMISIILKDLFIFNFISFHNQLHYSLSPAFIKLINFKYYA